ncbi:MAG: hypothetical protein ACRECV_19640 [Xanthobacteraceae bacterium]
MSKHPPRPRLALAVGVVGHRPNRLPAEQAKFDAIAREIEAVLEAIGREAAAALVRYGIFFTPERPLVSVVSALAEGADRMVAHAALACGRVAPGTHGIGADFVLDVPLPFPLAVYKDDFNTDAAKAEFDRLLTSARSVLVLPGDRGRPGASKQESELSEKKSYEEVGLTLLNQSDILLAVWDGGGSAGRGGTKELLDIAARSGMPVIHVDAKGEAATQIRWEGLSEFPASSNAIDDLPAASLGAALPSLIDELLRPPEDRRDEAFARTRKYGKPYPSRKPAAVQAPELECRGLTTYYETLLWRLNFGLAFPALMALLLIRPIRETDWRPYRPEDLSIQLAGFDRSTPPNARLPEKSALAMAFGWADACGLWLAQVFRSAFVMNFSFAALAVVIAAISLIASDITKLDMKTIAADLAWHKWPFVAAELFCIFFVLGITFAGWRYRWHQRWLEAREVAERLRIAFPLWTLGLRPTAFPTEEPAWTGWYARAIVRQQGMRDAVLDAAGLEQGRATLKAALSDQCQYHLTTAGRMARMERRLEFLGMILFGFTLLALIAFLVAVFSGATVPARLTYLVTAIAAGLPALGTAMFGIRVIGDFEGISRRSERTHQVLWRIVDATEADDPPNLSTLRARAKAASDVMLGDVAGWRLAAESRTLAIPG